MWSPFAVDDHRKNFINVAIVAQILLPAVDE